jgi:hypothetical protein
MWACMSRGNENCWRNFIEEEAKEKSEIFKATAVLPFYVFT